MKNIVLTIALAVAAVTAAVAAPLITWNIDKQEQIDFACTVLYISDDLCSQIVYPEIKIVEYPGVYGYYNGGNTIYITPSGINAAHGTLRHELVHYIDVMYRGYSMSSREAGCQSEANAFHVMNAWLIGQGREDEVRTEWYKQYGCDFVGPDFGNKTYD